MTSKHKQNIQVLLRLSWEELKSIMAKKPKNISEEEKQKHKAYFEGKKGVFIIEKLTRDVIERCKLPEAIELRKKFGHNHDNVMVCEEMSIAEKILKLFPDENKCIIQKFYR